MAAFLKKATNAGLYLFYDPFSHQALTFV